MENRICYNKSQRLFLRSYKIWRISNLSWLVRLMLREDVAQVTETDRESFPTLWPPVNYERELKNQMAHYIVACDEEKMIKEPLLTASPQESSSSPLSRVRQFLDRRFFNKNDELPPAGGQYILGFAGFWIMAGEAHITSLAVREAYRRQGIGELLLISLIGLAAELHIRIITLEVRVSNTVAQSLYSKYGFNQTGLRRGYYTDNKEDGVIMSTEDITSFPFQERLQQLRQTHARKRGIALYQIAR